jgi:hypothetical protein
LPQKSNMYMKITYFSGILCQIGTILIYKTLYKYIHDHNRIMLSNDVISNETFQQRRSVNVFSMAGQIVTFLVEIFFLVPMLCLLLIAEDKHLPKILFLFCFCRMIQSGLISTVQVCSSTKLRRELFSYF